jgi:hypothetical protein
MPTYSIAAPDGKTYQIDGPEGATTEQVKAEVMRQHPHLSAPVEKVSAPAEKVSTPRTYKLSQVPLESLANAPSSIAKTAKGLGTMVGGVVGSPAFAFVKRETLEDYPTLQAMWDVSPGMVNTLGGAAVKGGTALAGTLPGLDRKQLDEMLASKSDILKTAIDSANAAGGALAERYGGYENIKRTAAEDPAGALLDITGLLQGGAGLARKAGAGAAVNAIKSSPVGRAVESAASSSKNALLDAAGWTFDTLTGQRIPVATGKMARDIVGAENLAATKNALLTADEGVTAPQAVIGYGVNAPRVAALEPGDAAFRTAKREQQVDERLTQLQEQTPDMQAALQKRKDEVAPFWQEGDTTVKPLSPKLHDIITNLISPEQLSVLRKEAAAKDLDFDDLNTRMSTTTGARIYPTVSGKSLHNLKKMLADIAYGKVTDSASKITQGTARTVLGKYQPELYEHIPAYGVADELHRQFSAPVNQSVVMNYVTNKLNNSLSDVKEGASSFVNLTDSLDDMPTGVRTALEESGFKTQGKTLGDLLPDSAKTAIEDVNTQLKRDQKMKDYSAQGGSKELLKIIKPTPKIVDYYPLNTAYNVAIRSLNKIGLSVSEATISKLKEAAKTPEEFAKVLDTLPASEKSAVIKALKDVKMSKGALPAAAGNALAPDKENQNSLTK